jgi:preprotein translocase subunit SecE
VADNKPESKTNTAKRRVKNPETFREKALKASEAGETTTRRRRVASATGSGIKKTTGPFGRALKKIFGIKPFRILGKILLPTYFRNSWKELRKVEWPNWQESRRLTFAVLMFALVFGITIALVDYGLDKLFKNILIK